MPRKFASVPKNLENDFCAGDAEEDVSEESCNTAEEI